MNEYIYLTNKTVSHDSGHRLLKKGESPNFLSNTD